MAIVLPGDEVPMPGEKRVQCHQSPDLGQHAPADLLGLGRQADALIVGESHSAVPELLPEHTVLLSQIVDHVALLLIDPAGPVR
jgi:hypothetical protein